jgi:hypothetical protein
MEKLGDCLFDVLEKEGLQCFPPAVVSNIAISLVLKFKTYLHLIVKDLEGSSRRGDCSLRFEAKQYCSASQFKVDRPAESRFTESHLQECAGVPD